MDVKYIPADWEKMRSGLNSLIGKGFGKGMIDELKDISSNFEEAESDISKYDSDGVISFTHTDREKTYQGLLEDFDVLYRFTGKVGDIVDRTIDQPFYEDIDAFVTEVRELSISNYKTKNRIGVTDIVYSPESYQSIEVAKKEVGLDDVFRGDSFYGKQMALEYEAWKDLNVSEDTKDITQEDYQMAALNTRAFGYESIRDTQENKEFWVNIGVLAVIIGVTVLAVVVPPVGVPLALGLGAVYGSLEAGSAITGKDWISGRELGTGERWFRGVLAPLDIIPGAAALKKFSGVARVTSFAGDLGKLGKTTAQSSIRKVNDLSIAAGKEAASRLKNVGAVIKERALAVQTKLAEGAIGAGKVADVIITNTKNVLSNLMPGPELVPVEGVLKQTIENTHVPENMMKGVLSKNKGVNIGGKGASGTTEVTFPKGEQFVEGTKRLKPNIEYQAGEFEYIYKTDEMGRLKEFNADELKLTERNSRLTHNPKTAGKEDGDHAGHIAADRFGGSPDLDNLVSQSSNVNLSKYKKLENKWAKAIGEGKEVKVNVEINYNSDDLRPSGFDVQFTVDGVPDFIKINN